MPTAFGHAALAISALPAFPRGTLPKRTWLLGIAVSIAPDLDVIAFRFGIPYSHPFGHRGLFHSLLFAWLLAATLAIVASSRSEPRRRPAVLAAYLFVSAASHGLLDTLTDGGLGIALLSPFSNRRFFAPWRPIAVSPIGVTPDRWAKIKELVWDVLERPPEQRAEAIARLSADDPELQEEIQSLIRSIEDPGRLFEPAELRDQEGGPERTDAQPIFDTEQLLAGRHRIIRLLARGGMAEVYEAEDLELHQSVALKTVHPWIADDKVVIERFKREISPARKISHPNVCRIFDLGYESLKSDAKAERRITFLTMEFLRGETLSAKLARDGPMNPALALPII